MRAVIASGGGRYSDPWHPFAETSSAVAAILSRAGFDVEIDDDVDGVMRALESVDLLVVNAGDPWRGQEHATPPAAASLDGFSRALEDGIGVLAMHAATASLRDYPAWGSAIGRIWVPGSSYHPDADVATVTGLSLDDGTPVAGFELHDERYCRLQPIGTSHVVATHESPDGPEPTAWTRIVGRSRVAVDLLGHDARSFESAGHQALIIQLARWLTER
jgi:type 1 glutamine amidotransferase